MCPIPLVAAFQSLAEDSSAPDVVRKAAAHHFLQQAAAQTAVDTVKDGLSKPATGIKDFTDTIYSMNCKYFPKYMAQEGNVNIDSIQQQIKDGKLNKHAIMDLSGDLVLQNTEVYLSKVFGAGDGIRRGSPDVL
ncbi:hypothetical protein AB5N19_02087 [Seiridium cardinale]